MFHFFGLHVYVQQTVRSWGDSTAASLGTQFGDPWSPKDGWSMVKPPWDAPWHG